MKIVIACNDGLISSKICEGFRRAGIEYPLSQIQSQESALTLVAANSDRSSLLIFFGSQHFQTEDLSVLKQLCSAGGEKNKNKVVVIGPASSPRIILQAIHCGAIDYLDVDSRFEDELRNLLDRINTAQADRVQVGRLFTVVSPVGGTGASVLATNLAAALAQKEKVCGLLDFQLRGGDLATLLKCTPRHTLLSLADKASQLDKAMFEQSLIKHECGVHLLASPEPFSDYRQISPQVIQKIVQFSRSSCPNVIVDLEDAEHAEQVRTLAGSDQIIIPLRLDFVSLSRTKKCIDHLLRSKVSRDRIVLVANRAGQPKELPLDRAVEALELPIRHRIPDDPTTVNVSVNLGVPMVIAAPKAKVSTSIVRLAESLLGIEQESAIPVKIAKHLPPLKSMSRLFRSLSFGNA